jgi:hypothetical protein
MGGITDCVQLVTLHGGQRLTAYYFPLGLSITWQCATIWQSQRQWWIDKTVPERTRHGRSLGSKFVIHCRQKEICDQSCRIYVARMCTVRWRAVQQCSAVQNGGASRNSLLQELLSHNVDEDAARGKRKVSRSR